MVRNLFLVTFFSVLIISCKEEVVDTEVPSIAFYSPEDHGVTLSGDALKVDVEIKDNVQVEKYELRIIQLLYNKPFDTVELRKGNIKARSAALKFNYVYTIDTIGGAKLYEIHVKAYDNSGNVFQKSVNHHIAFEK